MAIGCTLIIWEEVPDRTSLFLVPNKVADQYRDFLRNAQGKYVNGDGGEDPGVRFLLHALTNGEPWEDGGFEKYVGLLKEYKVDDASLPLEDQTITHVYVSGFIL